MTYAVCLMQFWVYRAYSDKVLDQTAEPRLQKTSNHPQKLWGLK